MNNRLALIYIDQNSPTYKTFADTLVGKQAPHIYARNVETHLPNYLHAEVFQERKPQEGIWMKVLIPHRYVHWVLQDPDDEKVVGFCKTLRNENT